MAAKQIQISVDGAQAVWRTLPGSTGAFNEETSPIDDTIFGNIYQSQEAGLIGWSISADAIWKGFAGYLVELKQQGTSTSTTAEAMANESGLIYKISNATHNCWDRSAAITVYDDSSPVDAANIEWIDFLFGRVKFVTGYSVTGAITVDCYYFPLVTLGKGNSYTLTMTANMIDNTDFPTAQANGGYRTFDSGLRTIELEVGGIFDASVDAHGIVSDRSEILIEIDPAGDGLSIARGYFRSLGASQTGDVGALEESTLTFSLNVPDQENLYEAFNWQHDSSTLLSQSVRDILDTWLAGDECDARYLPTGATGASPLDGVQGKVRFSDISLSGGLEDMNTFAAEMQGSGAYTEV